MTHQNTPAFTRRDLLSMIGQAAGGGAMYQAMTSLGFAAESNFRGPPRLAGAKKGSSVLILGAGLAGMVAALELRNAGYKVTILEYNQRAGGRCWSIRGGDTFTELGGGVQHCGFAKGEYFNAGPWRIPYHHHAVLHYCRQLGVALEPFVQVNYNAWVHSSTAYGGKPQRYRHVQADFQGHVAELLGKATRQGSLDSVLTQEDKEKLLEGLRRWGALDAEFRYREGIATSAWRGYEIDPGGGLMPPAKPSKPLEFSELLQSRLWRSIAAGQAYEFQSTMFQPVGGMDMIAKAFAKQVGNLIRYQAEVTRIEQSERGVTVTFADEARGGALQQEKADWCLCTIPLSILKSDRHPGRRRDAGRHQCCTLRLVDQGGAAVQTAVLGGGRAHLRRHHLHRPADFAHFLPFHALRASGPAVVLGAYVFDGPNSFEFGAMAPQERVRRAVEYGNQIHPQYAHEFDNGMSVAWYRVPGNHGCYGKWTDALRDQHYKALCQVDGRIALAGEHVSHIPRVAGRRHPFLTRRNPAPACARHRLMARAT